MYSLYPSKFSDNTFSSSIIRNTKTGTSKTDVRKHGSWLNMVEGFFSKMTKQMLRGIRVKSKAELSDRIYLYFEEVNAEPVVFHWKYNLDDIDVSEEVIVDTLLLKKSS